MATSSFNPILFARQGIKKTMECPGNFDRGILEGIDILVRIIALEEPCLGVGWARRFCYALGEGVSNDPRGASVLAQILTLLSMIPVVVSRHCLLHKLAASGLYP
ncbi:hypothetical protein WG66_012030 [Moniliophthora roreri]|nr:hypothetical protein WG66_012030 [Moniliophthora roreri]